ncbi:MAG: M20 family metallopeptidase [Planctomycetota bacterium]|nr:M20 family metallopeptidase [Planctomycetota bacterium]MDA1161983.1 M20 family metallopeptidase [Planctomycetota bacterium]
MDALHYAEGLIRFDSTSYLSNQHVSDYAEQTLQSLGCETERIEYDDEGVLKVNVLGRKGRGSGGLAYFGHTDVVPTNDWSIAEHGPFEPVVRDGRLYGRGSTDMKGSIACMFAALASVGGEELKHPVYISCSSDEEIDHRGAIEISERSQLYRELVEGGACGIVGEPTSLDVVYAHKGGCQIFVTSHGKAAHSSTREGINANMAMIPFLHELKSICDETEMNVGWMDHEFDPPTLCVNLGINDHNRALNITAPTCVCTICLRPMPTTDVEAIIARIRGLVDQHGLQFMLKASNPPFRRDPDSTFVKQCVTLATGNAPRTVAYGSEAGNFTDIQNLIVMGPGDIAQAHKSDEWVSLEQLASGQHIYADMIRHFCR